MNIERVTEASDALTAAVARLVPQLTTRREPPTSDELAELLASGGAHLLLAREGEDVLGMLTLVVYRIPTGLRGRIEDVVVDESARGRGAGEALTQAALELATELNVRSVELSSNPAREAANRLYRRLGFEPRETNVYVWRPG
jgi:ribosomal protein S18 acetylase RimI-like enzyme